MSKKSSSTTKPAKPASETVNLRSQLARALADYSNLEKRFARDSSSVIKFANSNLLGQLLDFRDHLELTANNLSDQGLTLLIAELDKIFAGEGVVEIDTKGDFDPSCMECSEQVSGPENQIIAVSHKGYRLHDRILRSARVTVGNGIVNK